MGEDALVAKIMLFSLVEVNSFLKESSRKKSSLSVCVSA